MIVKHNLDLTDYNSYKVHSTAALALFPENEEDFLSLLVNENITNAHIIGKGCNTIFAKEYYDENHPLIFIRENYAGIMSGNGSLKVLAGTDLKELSVYAMEQSLTGMEYFYDIPGCVGGAITMNAGSCGVSFSDHLFSISYLDAESKKIQVIKKDDLKNSYRSSLFKGNNRRYIISCVLKLPRGEKEEIRRSMEEIVARRIAKQPREYPNAGSVFVRPAPTTYVGPMIEKLGLKGFRIGGAEVSTKHAGFIVNVENATGEDIVNLITYIQNRVREEFGIELETEQRIIK